MTLTTIYDVIRSTCGYKKDRHKGEFGVEIETETNKKYEYPMLKFWDCVRDGSLRDFGCEYVLKLPMNSEEFPHALAEFEACNKKYKFNKNCVTTSVHVHINMLNETYLTLANFLTAYAMVENILVRYAGPDRLSNLFCLPMCDAEGIVSHVQQMLTMIGKGAFYKSTLQSDAVKYGALNCAPLNKLGTIEVRLFRGETDIEAIQKWVLILKKLKTFAQTPGLTPVHILDIWRKEHAGILKTIFQEFYPDLTHKDEEKLIRENMKYSCRFATSTKDWSKFGVVKIKPVYKEQLIGQLDELSIHKFQVRYATLDINQRVVVEELFHLNNPDLRIVDSAEDL